MVRSIETDRPASEENAETDVIDVQKTVKAPEKAIISADDGVDELKKQLETEKLRRQELEQRTAAAETEVYKAKAEVQENQFHLINNAIETVKQNTASLKSAYAQAMAAGDYDRASDIQLQMSNNAAKLLQLENGKQAMQESPKPAPPPPPVMDPVETLASQLTPRSAAWVRAHPECAINPRMYQKMLAAHNLAVADGIATDTDEYFESVERTLGLRKPPVETDDYDDGTAAAAKAVSRRSSPAAAPVSRSGTASGFTSPNSIRLSAAEREIARMSNMTDREYWEQQQRIKREGRMN